MIAGKLPDMRCTPLRPTARGVTFTPTERRIGFGRKTAKGGVGEEFTGKEALWVE